MNRAYALSVLTVLLGGATVFAAPSTEALNKVADLQAQAKAKGWTFTVGYTPVMERTLQQATGFKMAPDWRLRANFTHLALHDAPPATWDWRSTAGLTPIKDQGQCGSCWAFGSTAALENAVKLFGNQTISLAEQELVDCDSAYQGCEGGDFALDYLTSTGETLTGSYAYTGQDGTCKTGLTAAAQFASWSFVGSNSETTPPTNDEIKAAIMQYGVVTTVIDATDSFMSYTSGVYNDCQTMDETQANHMVAIVGWNDATSSWIGRNSWNTSWGEQGYFEISYGCNAFGSAAAYGVLPASMTKAHADLNR